MGEDVSVLLADFQFLTREGMRILINNISGLEIVGELKDRSNLPEQVGAHAPDLLVLDFPRGVNKDLLDNIEEVITNKSTNILIITNNQRKDVIQQLLRIGVKGAITKNCSEEEIITALKSVSKGNRFFCNTILDLVIDDPAKKNDSCDPTVLSPREYEVLELVAQGLSTNHIADQLFVSVHTINSHRKNILKKLNLKSPTEMIVYALESGLVKKK